MRKLFFLVSILFFSNPLFAQTYSCPNFTFTRNLAQGAVGADVRVIQEILNLDKRTIVAPTGAGSPGRETTTYGIATREALKRFQALFIEYIGVADGKFTDKTRLVMNNVCKGNFFTGGGGDVYDLSNDKVAPKILINAPATATPMTFRAILKTNEPIKTPDPAVLLVDGGTASGLVKISPVEFRFNVNPTASIVTLQIEAGQIEDLAGNKNDNASNEASIQIIGEFPATTTASSTPVVEDILPPPIPEPVIPNIEIPALPNTTNPNQACGTTPVNVNDYTNPCYGKSPFTYDNQQNPTQPPSSDPSSGSGGGLNIGQIGQLLSGLLKAFTGQGGAGAGGEGGAGGGTPAGGTGAINGNCNCPGPTMGRPTVMLTPLQGPGGIFYSGDNPGSGNYTGRVQTTPPAICGMGVPPAPSRPGETLDQRCQRQYPGSTANTEQCCGPRQNTRGLPVVGTIPRAPTFCWGSGGCGGGN